MALVSFQRKHIALALSLFFILSAYYLWTQGHDILIASPLTGGTPHNGDNDNLVYSVTPVKTSSASQPLQSPDPDLDGQPSVGVVMDEFDDAPIKELCAKTSWESSADVVINCEGRVGGVGNVRQEILVCVRHAIDIGAGLIRPTIMLRSADLVEYQRGPIEDLNYMFDREKFDVRLRAACPLLPLYDDLQALEKQGRPIGRVARPRDLPEENGEPMSPKKWAEMNRQGDGKITVIDMPLIMRQTAVCRDDTAFVVHFGGLLEFRADAQLLASHALAEISARFNTPQAARLGITEDAFIGVHLRTEIDAVNAGYTSHEAQVAAYLPYINSTSLRAVYAASGNTTSLELFGQEAATLSPPAHILTKWDLLNEEDTAHLKSLTWDQEALVDFLILEKSSKFAGVSESSFSWGLVYARQKFGDRSPCTGNSSEELYNDDGVVYKDSLSEIYGVPKDWHVDKLWP